MPVHTVFGVERNIDVPLDVFMTSEETKEREDLMPDCEHGWFASCHCSTPLSHENAQLHYRKWINKKNNDKPKAIVIYTHGIQAHSGEAFVTKDGEKLNVPLLYERLVNEEGYALYAHDMYGHGYSEGKRWLIPESWENNLKDCLEFARLVCKEHDPDTPVFLLGLSYGANLSIHTARYFQDHPDKAPANFRGTVLLAPAIQGDLPPYPVYMILRYGLAPLFPQWRPFFMPNPISSDRVWRDPEVRAIRTSPRESACQLGGSGTAFRLGTALNLVLALEEVRAKAIPGFNTPFCILHGTDDYGVPIAGSHYMMATATTPQDQKALFEVEGGYHDLLSDPLRESVTTDMCAWMEKQLLSK